MPNRFGERDNKGLTVCVDDLDTHTHTHTYTKQMKQYENKQLNTIYNAIQNLRLQNTHQRIQSNTKPGHT